MRELTFVRIELGVLVKIRSLFPMIFFFFYFFFINHFLHFVGELNIGDFVNKNLYDVAKYRLLTNHFKPDCTYKFSSREQHGCNRAFKHHWLTSYSFLAYSKKCDSLYCLPCTLFDKAEISGKSIFAKNAGFSSWFKIKEKVLEHINCEGTDVEKKTCKHSRMMADAEDLIQRFKNPSKTIPYSFNNTKESRVAKNREILKWVIKTIILCGKQCIALRGHREDIIATIIVAIFLLF